MDEHGCDGVLMSRPAERSGKSMLIQVIPLPNPAHDFDGDVCIVIDVVRATTTLVSLFDAGCEQVSLARSRFDAARVRALVGNACLICSEQDDGTAPPGFDHDPSPSKLARLDLSGRHASLSTANGTPAAASTVRQGASMTLFGSLRNASASTAMATREAAARGVGVSIVCSGRMRNQYLALEDVYCAGVLVQRLLATSEGANGLDLDDSARLAVRLTEVYADPYEAMVDSTVGRRYVELGREEDVRYCAELDRSDKVPVVALPGAQVAYPVVILDD
jgi:2-phosphosulfolactate phosphatase